MTACASACASPPARPDAEDPDPVSDPQPPSVAEAADAPLQPGPDASGATARPSLTDCAETPFARTDASKGEALRGAWFECEHARLYAARIDGPESFVRMLVDASLDNQKRLAKERAGFEVTHETRSKVSLGEESTDGWRVELLAADERHRAVMIETSLVRDGAGYAFACVAPREHFDAACDDPFDELMTFATALAE